MATALLEVVERRGHTITLATGPGRGIVLCHCPGVASQQTGDIVAMVAEARQLATQVGGYALVECCPLEVKRGLDVWGSPGDGLPIMRRLKEQMDPRRILNPGRFVGGI